MDTVQQTTAIEIEECRAGGGGLTTVLNLGEFVRSDFMKRKQKDPPSYPLEVCVGQKSGLAQLRHTVPSQELYSNYYYKSGTNELMVDHLRGIATEALRRRPVANTEMVLDIGCNDGTLLKAFGWRIGNKGWRIGCDPSNIEPLPHSMEIHWAEFFSADKYPGRHTNMPAGIVLSIAMFYDIADPVTFCREVASIMADDGLWVIEQHYLPTIIKSGGFDAICHEHLAYYSLTSLQYVLAQAGLVVIDVETNTINGGSFRTYVQKRGS